MNSAQQTTKKNNTRGKMLAQGDSPGEAKTKITHRNLKDASAKHGCLFVKIKKRKNVDFVLNSMAARAGGSFMRFAF